MNGLYDHIKLCFNSIEQIEGNDNGKADLTNERNELFHHKHLFPVTIWIDFWYLKRLPRERKQPFDSIIQRLAHRGSTAKPSRRLKNNLPDGSSYAMPKADQGACAFVLI